MIHFLCCSILFLSVFAIGQPQPALEKYRAHNYNGVWTLEPGVGGIADASILRAMNSSGWDVLMVVTNPKASDSDQAYAAGYLEAGVTWQSIWNAWINFNETTNLSKPGLSSFVLQQDTWLRNQVQTLSPTSQYWAQVGLVLSQLDGLIKGYADFAPPSQQLSYLDQLYLQLQPELSDIKAHLEVKAGPYAEIRKPNPFNSHCSVLIRASPDGRSLYSAHDTWSGYDTMLRIYKYYLFNYNLPSNQAPLVAFSSYPGNLQSTDDFYLTSQKLFVAETTNEVFNNSLFANFIAPQSVPEWIRVILANRMAGSGEEWSSVYQQYNSGTYNNQFQVVDYKLFTPGEPIKANTLWIIEQIPGMIQASDETSVLTTKGFWPSYNIPFYPSIYNISGYPAVYNLYGNSYSYSECARAQIFRRDAPSVANMDDMKRIMRYNKFQTDPLSLRDACRGISARCDLNTPWSNNTLNGFSAFGGIDSKITDNILIQNHTCWAVNGPSWDNQPPFAWTDTWKHVPHYGMPDLFDFTFQIMPDFNFNPFKDDLLAKL